MAGGCILIKLHESLRPVTQVQALHANSLNYSNNYIVIPQPEPLVAVIEVESPIAISL